MGDGVGLLLTIAAGYFWKKHCAASYVLGGYLGFGGGGGGDSAKFFTGKVQTLTLLYTIFDRKGTPFIYLQ